MDEEMTLGEVLEKDYIKPTVCQEATNAIMVENLAKHLTLQCAAKGRAQLVRFDGFIERETRNPLVAPVSVTEMWNDSVKEEYYKELVDKGNKELNENRRVLVTCFAFGKEKVSDDGTHYLDPWKGHYIEKSEIPDLLGLANFCFWYYVNILGHNNPDYLVELDPQPLFLAYHWENTDSYGLETCPHVHMLFSVNKRFWKGESDEAAE